MTDTPNDQDEKHRPAPKTDPRKEPVVTITQNIMGNTPYRPREDKKKNRRK